MVDREKRRVKQAQREHKQDQRRDNSVRKLLRKVVERAVKAAVRAREKVFRRDVKHRTKELRRLTQLPRDHERPERLLYNSGEERDAYHLRVWNASVAACVAKPPAAAEQCALLCEVLLKETEAFQPFADELQRRQLATMLWDRAGGAYAGHDPSGSRNYEMQKLDAYSARLRQREHHIQQLRCWRQRSLQQLKQEGRFLLRCGVRLRLNGAVVPPPDNSADNAFGGVLVASVRGAKHKGSTHRAGRQNGGHPRPKSGGVKRQRKRSKSVAAATHDLRQWRVRLRLRGKIWKPPGLSKGADKLVAVIRRPRSQSQLQSSAAPPAEQQEQKVYVASANETPQDIADHFGLSVDVLLKVRPAPRVSWRLALRASSSVAPHTSRLPIPAPRLQINRPWYKWLTARSQLQQGTCLRMPASNCRRSVVFQVGDRVEAFWQPDSAWYGATVAGISRQTAQVRYVVAWDMDGSVSEGLSAREVRKKQQ